MHTSATPRPKDFRQDGDPELGTGYAGPRGRTDHSVISVRTSSVGAPPGTQCSGGILLIVSFATAAVDVVEVCSDSPVVRPFAGGQNDFVDAGQASLPFLDDLRTKGGVGVSRDLDLDRADLLEHRFHSSPVAGVPCISPLDMVFLVSEVFIHLGVERGFQNVRCELVEQPVRASQLDAPGFCLRVQLLSQLLMVHLQLIHGIECFGHRLSLLAKLARRVGPIEFNRFPDSPPSGRLPPRLREGSARQGRRRPAKPP